MGRPGLGRDKEAWAAPGALAFEVDIVMRLSFRSINHCATFCDRNIGAVSPSSRARCRAKFAQRASRRDTALLTRISISPVRRRCGNNPLQVGLDRDVAQSNDDFVFGDRRRQTPPIAWRAADTRQPASPPAPWRVRHRTWPGAVWPTAQQTRVLPKSSGVCQVSRSNLAQSFPLRKRERQPVKHSLRYPGGRLATFHHCDEERAAL